MERNHELSVNLVPRSFLKTRESAPLALTLTEIRAMAPQTHQTGLSLSCKNKKNASINANSWNRNGSAHAMKDMNCRCVSSARPLTDVSATIHHRMNAATAPMTSLMIYRLNALRPTSSALLPAHTLKLDHLSQWQQI